MPFALMDEDIPDHWTCSENQWDESHNSCAVPQALSDAEIDEILLAQVRLGPQLKVIYTRGKDVLLQERVSC